MGEHEAGGGAAEAAVVGAALGAAEAAVVGAALGAADRGGLAGRGATQ